MLEHAKLLGQKLLDLSTYVRLFIAFPDRQDLPSLSNQPLARDRVPMSVTGDLLGPVTRVALGDTLPLLASVSMPKTAVDKNYLPLPTEYQVWLTRQILCM